MLFRNQFTLYKKDNHDQENKELDDSLNLQNSLKIKNNSETEKFLQKIMNLDPENLKKNIKNLLVEDSKNNKKFSHDLNYYNLNWEDDFRREGLSLEDDGNYEYIDGDDKMALEYFNGELPKTKISKNKLKTKSGAEVKDGQQLVNDELINLKAESAVVQKAWLANNNRINELIEIVEAQERELKQLRLQKSQNFFHDNFKSLLERVEKLEKNNDLGSSSEDQASLEKLKKENQKLKELLDIKEQSKIASEPMSNFSIPKDQKSSVDQKEFKKRKQEYFFVIKEHDPDFKK